MFLHRNPEAFPRKARFLRMSVNCLWTGRSKKKGRCLRAELYPLVEMEACPCDNFLSRPYGNWSSCILPESPGPSAMLGWRGKGEGLTEAQREARECGQGLRYRALLCLDQQEQVVSHTLCSDSGTEVFVLVWVISLFMSLYINIYINVY